MIHLVGDYDAACTTELTTEAAVEHLSVAATAEQTLQMIDAQVAIPVCTYKYFSCSVFASVVMSQRNHYLAQAFE